MSRRVFSADLTQKENPSKREEGAEASSCAKAIIVGEHAVVYGASAVSMPLHAMEMSIQVKVLEKGAKTSFLFGNRPVPKHVAEIVSDAFRILSLKEAPLKIEGCSGILIGSGLGSSAALSVVMLKALAKIYNLHFEPGEIASMARELESRFHGKSSGLDTSTVAWAQTILFKPGEGTTVIKCVAPEGVSSWPFVLVDSGLRSSTFSMIKVAEPYFRHPRDGERRIASFDQMALDTARILGSGQILEMAGIIDKAHHMLKETGVVNAGLEKIAEEILNSGALAVKVTGAGGGGCLLALLSPAHFLKQLTTLRNKFGHDKVFVV